MISGPTAYPEDSTFCGSTWRTTVKSFSLNLLKKRHTGLNKIQYKVLLPSLGRKVCLWLPTEVRPVPDPWRFYTDLDPFRTTRLRTNGFQDTNKKILLKRFSLLFSVRRFRPVLKGNKILRSHKTVEIMVFLNFLLVDKMFQIRKIIRIRMPQKLTVPRDSDPEHWREAQSHYFT